MEHDFHYSSETEWDNAEARELGALRPDCAWIVTNRDVTHANPYYVGPPVPHPDELEEVNPLEDLREGDELPGPVNTVLRDTALRLLASGYFDEDEIPF